MMARIRVFAGELSGTSLQQPSGSKQSTHIMITPSGACGSYLLLAGALTRVEKAPGEFLHAWVADPTGTFNLSTAKQEEEVVAVLEQADPPVFVLVTGEVQFSRDRKKGVVIRPLTIQTIDRIIRDSWIIRTAEQTLERLETIEKAITDGTDDLVIRQAINHYHLDSRQIRSFVDMVEEALSKVDPVPGGPLTLPDPRDVLLELIKIHSGPKGVSISELLPLAAGKGIRGDQVVTAIRQLVEDDECYQPAAGSVKLL
jgi:RPA family protein